MPTLPSGLVLALSRTHFIDHVGNWFDCPDGHFWYWLPDEEISGPPPYPPGVQIMSDPVHSPIPKTREDVAKFIQVIEIDKPEKKFYWRGEWLESFPLYTALDSTDMAVWTKWLSSSSALDFFDETIEKCGRLARDSANSQGFATFHSAPPSEDW
jgi:hypothetical protein